MTTQQATDAGCEKECPVRKTAEVIGHKWTTLIVRDLLTGKKRYSELARSLAGVSPKVLSERLHSLEASGLVLRTVHPTIPPTTEYELTPTGRGLENVIQAMAEFGRQLLGEQGKS
jgi:DNA-binding HxlR family transcriptional regulator